MTTEWYIEKFCYLFFFIGTMQLIGEFFGKKESFYRGMMNDFWFRVVYIYASLIVIKELYKAFA